ncbi:MAG TPA: sulfite exporter TauE/SafE family protein [Candidatus Saccharimonadales bacterium]|jgi:hypothetical protein
MLSIGLFVACLIAGMVNSVAGGGIMVVFPALLALGLPPLTANTTSNLISWPGALSSAYGYRAHLRKLPPKYLFLLVPCFVGSIIGSILLARTDSAEFSKIVPYLVLAAVLLFLVQPFLHRHLAHNLKAHRNAPIIIIGIALLPMSIYGGYFGAGFGFLMLAFLGFTRITSMHQINGLKNLASATITLVCTVYFGWKGLIDWQYAPIMITGSLLGGYFGARWAQRVNVAVVHYFVIVLGLALAGVLFYKS